jgi:hypothetical protein
LCQLDNRFPPKDLWVEYYKIFDLQEIFFSKNVAKKSSRKL